MSKKVLICDDAAFMRMMLKDILTRNEFEVCGEAANGIQAVERYKELRPDLVFMDITMPEMDGTEALKKILAFDPAASVIMLSAMGQQQAVTECMLSGAKNFVVKPFQSEKVIETVKKVIG